jgi:hypothetical protein
VYVICDDTVEYIVPNNVDVPAICIYLLAAIVTAENVPLADAVDPVVAVVVTVFHVPAGRGELEVELYKVNVVPPGNPVVVNDTSTVDGVTCVMVPSVIVPTV